MEMKMDYSITQNGTSFPNAGSMKSLASAFSGSLLVFAAPGFAIAAQQGKQREGFAPVSAWSSPKTADAPTESELTAHTGDTLEVVRRAFGFNVTELAEVFGVSRPTVYKWLKGAEVKRDFYTKIQVLAAVAEHWREVTGDEGWFSLLDYKGSGADQPSLRETLKGGVLDAQSVRELIDTRKTEYDQASAKSRGMMGGVPPVKHAPVAAGTRSLNERWTENANRLKNSGRSL